MAIQLCIFLALPETMPCQIERLGPRRYSGAHAENTTNLYLGEHPVAQHIV